MSKNRMINTRFWSDSFVVDKCNALDRLLFLYLLTNEKTNIIGIYELPLRTAAFETGIEKDDLEKMLLRLSPKVEYFDGWVYIRKFTDHQQSNPSVEKGMMREFFALPERVLTSVKSLGIDSDTLSKAFDMLAQSGYSLSPSSDSVSVTKPKLNLTKPKLKPYGIVDTKVSTGPATAKASPVSNEEVQELFDYWHQVVGTNIRQTNTGVDYVKKLHREHGIANVKKLIDGVALTLDDRYAPRISNFNDLYLKKDKFLLWGRKRSSDQGDRPKIAKIS